MALVAARRPHRALDLVAGPQLAAADLRRRDVDVLGRVRERLRPHEAASVGKDVEHAAAHLGVLVVGVRVVVIVGLRRGLGLGLWSTRTARPLLASGALVVVLVAAGPAATTPAAAAAAARTRALVIGVVASVGRGVGGRGSTRVAGDRIDQLLAAQEPVALDAELRRDRVEIGERALLELFSVQDGHGGAQLSHTPPDGLAP
jgi:hypothetical protein